MSLFSSKKPRGRQFRKKIVHSVDESEEGEQQNHESNETTKNENTPVQNVTEKEPMVSTKLSSRPALSFNDDLEEGEGEEVFQVKKTNHSKRVAKMMEREKRKEKRLKEAMQVDSRADSDEEEVPLFSLSHRLSTGAIPDAAMVHAARKKREIMRKLGSGGTTQEYIAIDRSTHTDTAKGKSRLIREDEYDKSDDSDNEEEGPARTFGRRTDPSRQMKVLEALENAESGSDEDRFVEEQINKGVSVNIPTSRPLNSVQQPPTMVDSSFLYPGLSDPAPSINPAPPTIRHQDVTSQMNRLQIPEKLVPITMESLKSRLQNQLRDVRETHSSHTQRLERMEDDSNTAEREIVELEERTGSLSVDYQFYQQMRGYIRDLLSCLTAKNSVIDGIEQSLHGVLKERAELLLERRRQDVRDQAEECTTTDVTVNQPVGVEARQMRSVEREGRRRRRREKRGVGGAPHYDGTSSDDELLETNRMKFVRDIDKLVSQSEEVFSDVVEDFCKLSVIKERFERWKFHLPSSYNQAFVSLCLPKIFAPFVRLQLFNWNPLDENCSLELEDMNWFGVLMFYGFREGHDLDPSDEDLQLIPQLVDQAVIPKITALLQNVWDPLSSSQTLRLISLLKRLIEDYPTVSTEHQATRTLINAVTLKLRQAIDNDVYIPLFASKQLENTSSSRYLFYQRQFWSCLKLLGNITQWAGLIDQDVLQELVFDGLLNRYLLLSLQNCPTSLLSVTKAQTIIANLPSSWYKDGSVVRRALQGFVRYLIHLVEVLHRAAVGQPDVERTSTRRAIHNVTSLLVKVGAKKEATEIAKQHGLNDVMKLT